MDMNRRIDELLEISGGIVRGEIPSFRQNECYTAGAYDLLLISADASAAYSLLVEACRRYEGLKLAGSSLEGYYHLLLLLARRSNTTEMPPGIQDIINERPELSTQLRQWYRCEG